MDFTEFTLLVNPLNNRPLHCGMTPIYVINVLHMLHMWYKKCMKLQGFFAYGGSRVYHVCFVVTLIAPSYPTHVHANASDRLPYTGALNNE